MLFLSVCLFLSGKGQFDMRLGVFVTALLMCAIALNTSVQAKKKNPELYNIVLIGATGDLAKKYLWKALFNLFKEKFVKDEVKLFY